MVHGEKEHKAQSYCTKVNGSENAEKFMWCRVNFYLNSNVRSHWPCCTDFELVDSMVLNLYLHSNNCIFIYPSQRQDLNDIFGHNEKK